MLILQRKEGESLLIGDEVELTVLAVEAGRVRLAIQAPRSVTIVGIAGDEIPVSKTKGDRLIPHTGVTHRVILVEKISPTPEKYPRRWAKMQKAPL